MIVKQNVIYPELNTPCLLLDLDILEANIKEMSDLAREGGVKIRPHIKVHDCAEITKMQIAAGACGVEVGNVDQAAALAEEGIYDTWIAHPFCDDVKFQMLQKLLTDHPKIKLAIVVDMVVHGEGLSKVGQTVGRKIPVIIKIDTGVGRYGVLAGAPTLELAKKLSKLPGIQVMGIYAHESGLQPTEAATTKGTLEVGSLMIDSARMLRENGFDIEEVTIGASPTFRSTCRLMKEGLLKGITEIHPGGNVIGDIGYMKAYACKMEQIALTVLTTVQSTSHPGHCIINAGAKSLTNDAIIGRRDDPGFFWDGKPSFGVIKGRPDLWLGRLGGESGWLYYKDPSKPLTVGERIEIVPNNSTVIINMHDKLYGVRNGKVEKVIKVTGAGLGS